MLKINPQCEVLYIPHMPHTTHNAYEAIYEIRFCQEAADLFNPKITSK